MPVVPGGERAQPIVFPGVGGHREARQARTSGRAHRPAGSNGSARSHPRPACRYRRSPHRAAGPGSRPAHRRRTPPVRPARLPPPGSCRAARARRPDRPRRGRGRPAAPAATDPVRPAGSMVPRWRGRQDDGEGRAFLIAVALRADRAAVQLDEVPRDRQAEPEPAVRPRRRAVPWRNRSKTNGRNSGAIPAPVSAHGDLDRAAGPDDRDADAAARPA